MPITKEKKKEILVKLGGIIKESESIVFVGFKGLSVANATELRRKMRSEGVGYYVSKKTLIQKAAKEAKFEGDMPVLEGEVAVAYGKDLLSPAREVYGFQKKFSDKISILGGVFEKKFFDKAKMMEIATIPPLKTLHGMFVNVINSPIQGFVMVLNEISKKKPV